MDKYTIYNTYEISYCEKYKKINYSKPYRV